MRFAENDDVVEALTAQGSDQTLRVRVLPGAYGAHTSPLMPCRPRGRRRIVHFAVTEHPTARSEELRRRAAPAA